MNARSRWALLCCILLSLAIGLACAAKRVVLAPAPTDTLASNGGAVAEADGVRIVVTPNAWNGNPADLPDRVQPLRVSITNHSSRALRVVYSDFALRAPNGKLFADLPPYSIHGTEYVSQNSPDTQYASSFVQKKAPPAAAPAPAPHAPTVVIVPDFDYDDFYYAPYWAYGYDGLSPWPYPWAPDWAYYDNYYPYMQRIHLPTRSMLKKGIPEGVIKPNGHVTGFLYFQKVDPKEKDVTFTAKLQDASNGQIFGKLEIPLVVRK